MSSTRVKNDVFEENDLNDVIFVRSSFVPRQISFSQRGATCGEIILVLLPYLIFLLDILLFFILRGFKLTSFNGSILPN